VTENLIIRPHPEVRLVLDTIFYQVKMFRILRSAMDKKDIMYGVTAVVIILVMALVVKPAMTGQPVIPASRSRLLRWP